MDDIRRSFAARLLGEKVDSHFRAEVTHEANSLSSPPPEIAQSRPGPAETNHRSLRPIPGIRVVPSACFSCNTNCEVLIFVEEATGRVLKVEGDPESPVTRGVLCAKGLAAKDLVTNPGRLLHPLRRTGERGAGQWERISWEEAFDQVSNQLLSCKERYGPQGIAFLEGTRRGWSRVFSRLANVFGGVNHGAAGWAQCLWPRLVDNTVTFGSPYMELADYPNSRCILVWGMNPPATWPVRAADIMDARERGARLIVVDPYFSETAAKADLWVQLHPGTDTALALLNVILSRNLHDRAFVEKWTTGLSRLWEHVSDCTPEWAERITRVPAPLIVKVAETYAGLKPASISRCVALDEVHDSVQACRAVSLLAAVTGNIGVPGGNILGSNRGEISQNTHEFIGHHLLAENSLHLRCGYDRFPLLCGKLSPVPSAHMPTLWETMATGKPYPIKAALVFGSNALVSYAETPRVREALKRLDFLAVADLFMTPTAEMADIVLPASSWLERDNVISSFQTSDTCTVLQQKAVSLPEAKSDVEIIIGLAERLGIGHHFWPDATALYDYLLEPTGLTFEEWKPRRRIFAPLAFRQYKKSGFKTPSGKIELYASLMEKVGCAPLPPYTEPPDDSPSAAEGKRGYPFILTVGRVPVFRHTENRQNPLLREICPEARFLIHPETAQDHGIRSGDRITIETETGAASGLAELTEGLQPDVIRAVPGWGGEENLNEAVPWGNYAEGIGTVCMRSVPCRIRANG